MLEIRSISKWSDKMKAPLIELYGEAGLQAMWNGWCDALQEILKKGGNLCKEHVEQIKCPTLILHGKKDPMVAPEHPGYLKDNIKGSKYVNYSHHFKYFGIL